MAALCDRLAAAGFSSVRLTVRVEDRGARSFYGDHGFSARSLFPNHYDDGDGLLLVRSV
jgi:ribosomal-protein-alanine N-acetyltransferase